MGHKVQRFDGYYNNLAYPTWGSAGMSRTFLLKNFELLYLSESKEKT